MNSFRLVTQPSLTGARNMAIDAALLRVADQTDEPFLTLRLFSWQCPTVSLGTGQKLERAINLHACRDRHIPVVRRPTGGRAVLHDKEITYSVISNRLELFGGSGIHPTYLLIARALQQALLGIGCQAEISPGNLQRQKDALHQGKRSEHQPPGGWELDDPCFFSTSRSEITVAGRKLVGSAQRRTKRAFLQHGSILLHCDYGRDAEVLGGDEESLRQAFAGIDEFVESSATHSMLWGFIPRAFSELLGLRPQTGTLNDVEEAYVVDFLRSAAHSLAPPWPI